MIVYSYRGNPDFFMLDRYGFLNYRKPRGDVRESLCIQTSSKPTFQTIPMYGVAFKRTPQLGWGFRGLIKKSPFGDLLSDYFAETLTISTSV